MRPSRWSALLGAAFLMATSAIGPGFLTQTVVFTERLAASFGFVILLSILIDLGAQTNIWRVIVAAGKPGQEIAGLVLPGLGSFLACLIVLGGLAFNIGNIAGAALGCSVLFGWPPAAGALASAALAIGIFLVREAGRALDRFVQAMAALMILLTLYVACTSRPPIGEAVWRTFAPARIDVLATVTLVGGTVGGYITFAGGHRLLNAGLRGPAAVPSATRAAVTGIAIASAMRVLLFLAALGVVAHHAALDPANPPASVFRLAAGDLGYKLFGLVIWSAAMTSVVGSAYTSVSFLNRNPAGFASNSRGLIIGFIAISTSVFLAVGQPVKVLILAGALNGLVLPISLGTMLIAARQKAIVGEYRHPHSLALFGAAVVVLMAALGIYTICVELPRLWR